MVIFKIFLVLMSIFLMSFVVQFITSIDGVITRTAKLLFAVTLLQSDNLELHIFFNLLVYYFKILSLLTN